MLVRRRENSSAVSRLNVYECVAPPSIHKVHSFVVLRVISAIRIICPHFHFFYRNSLVFVNAVTYDRFSRHNKVDRGSGSSTTQSTRVLHAVRRYSSRTVQSRHVSVVPRPCDTSGAHRTGGTERSKEPVRTSHQSNAVDNKLPLQGMQSRSSGHKVHTYNLTLLAHSFCYCP